MHRTNIYLSEEQHRRIGTMAASDGVTRAAVVRRLIDAALGAATGPSTDSALEASFGIWAGRPDEEVGSALGWRRSDRFGRLGL